MLRDGRYTIQRHLAQGGMGSIYLAHDAATAQACVIKEMLPKTDPAERAEAEHAFVQEAATLAELNHAHIVTVWDYFEDGGSHYLTEEFIGGGDLAALIRQPEAVSEARLLDIAIQIADAFHYIHTYHRVAPAGSSCTGPIIYRDMKPANVMVRGDGRVVVADFGIVRLFKPGKTRDTINLGTQGYAAPEMISNIQSDERSDIYTLGATLHELLTKRDPANNVNHFLPIRQFRPDVSPELERIVMRMLENIPAQRYQSAAELLNDLRTLYERWRAAKCAQPNCGHHNPVSATCCERCGLPLKAVTGQEAVAHGGEARLGTYPSSGSSPWSAMWQMGLRSKTRGMTGLHRAQVAVATEDGHLAVLDVRTGRGLHRLSLPAPSRSTPVTTPWGVVVGHRQGAVLCDPVSGQVQPLPVPPAEIFATPVSDRDDVFIGNYNGQVFGIDLKTRQVRWSTQVGDCILGALALDSKDLAVTTKSGQISVLDRNTGAVRWSHRTGKSLYGHALLADDAVIGLDTSGRLILLDRLRGSVMLQVPVGGDCYNSPAFAHNRLYTCDVRGSVRCHSTSSGGQPEWQRPLGEDVLASPVVSGQQLIQVTRQGRIYILDVQTGRDVQPPISTPTDFVASPVIDGNTLLVLDQGGALMALVN
ncbi:protein kinase domain-containing protein [Deinococcus arenae]|uniref:protein kinase domain-containing protein n=1 Tax=Deinococcus arenae TaxID=1452751 RepID=UPI00227D7B48|nr:PQQ-binding-like beta-propeller repeat protein [Deinococcus arenae]